MSTQPRVRDFTSRGSAKPNVEVALHGAVDFLVTLWLLDGCDRDTQPLDEYGLGADWFSKISDSLSDETRSLVEQVGPGRIWISVMSILERVPDGSTVAEFIEHVAAMDPVDLRLALLSVKEADDPEYARLAPAAAAGDLRAVGELLALPVVSNHDRYAAGIRDLLTLQPSETMDLVIRAMRGVQGEVFEGHEREFRPILERDIEAKRTMADRVSTERFVELATNGISIEKQGYRRPILLIPSIVGRPWNIFTESADRMIIAYPVADEYMQADPDAPPAWLIKTYKALGDERRLRILRRLSGGPASLHELADELQISKSTLHHHMMLLRTAGLVKILIGTEKEYALRKDVVPETTAVLQAYIDRTGGN